MVVVVKVVKVVMVVVVDDGGDGSNAMGYVPLGCRVKFLGVRVV